MNIKLSILILFAAMTSMANAQDAQAILDKASEAYNKAGGVETSFTLDTKDTKAKETYSYDGKAYMKGDKFRIEIPDATTWFDGTTQWVYIKDTEEVNVSAPSGNELQAISPSVLFNIYKKGYKLSYKGERNITGKTIQEVELIPQKKGGDFTRIIVQIDKANNIFHKITLIDKTGLENELTIKNYQTGRNLSDSSFRFDKKDYPDVEIIDLR